MLRASAIFDLAGRKDRRRQRLDRVGDEGIDDEIGSGAAGSMRLLPVRFRRLGAIPCVSFEASHSCTRGSLMGRERVERLLLSGIHIE
jgi:hypothetical protein